MTANPEHKEIRPISEPGPISTTAPKTPTMQDLKNEINRLHHRIRTDAYTHDIRVAELIRYNSEQVIKRREINAHRHQLIRACLDAARQYRFYAVQHREKCNHPMSTVKMQETMAKAKVNDDMAQMIEEALIWEPEPGAMGKA